MTALLIPTYNRLAVWRGGLLLDSLKKQIQAPDLMLVCDDGSTDGTCDELPLLLSELSWPVKLFRTTADKLAKRQASALPDNVLFANADPSWVWVHLDDDGWVDADYVKIASELVENGDGIYYSRIDFMHPDTLAVLYEDTRLKHYPAHQPSRIIHRFAWGAAYSVRGRLIREIGGHCMDVKHMLGADSRLGYRLTHRAAAWFAPSLVFHHLGPSYIQCLKLVGRETEIDDNRLTPVRQPGYKPSIIANGGLDFWTSGELETQYELVWQQ